MKLTKPEFLARFACSGFVEGSPYRVCHTRGVVEGSDEDFHAFLAGNRDHVQINPVALSRPGAVLRVEQRRLATVAPV